MSKPHAITVRHVHREKSNVRACFLTHSGGHRPRLCSQQRCRSIESNLHVTDLNRVEGQPAHAEIVEHFILGQHGAVWTHKHVVVGIDLRKRFQILRQERPVEPLRVRTNNVLCRHSRCRAVGMFSITVTIRFPHKQSRARSRDPDVRMSSVSTHGDPAVFAEPLIFDALCRKVGWVGLRATVDGKRS